MRDLFINEKRDPEPVDYEELARTRTQPARAQPNQTILTDVFEGITLTSPNAEETKQIPIQIAFKHTRMVGALR